MVKYTSFIGGTLYKEFWENDSLREAILGALARDSEKRGDDTYYEVYLAHPELKDLLNIDIKFDNGLRVVSKIFIDVFSSGKFPVSEALRLFCLMNGDDILIYECVRDGEIPNLVKTLFYGIDSIKGGDCVVAS